MSNSQREKGLAGEREVAAIFKRAGHSVRSLKAQGDALVVLKGGQLLHVEVKRQERLKLPEWLRQARNETPPGVPPLIIFRQTGDDWLVGLRLDDLLRMVG